MFVTGTGLEELLEGGEADWVGLADESGRGFIKNEYEMSSGGKKFGPVGAGSNGRTPSELTCPWWIFQRSLLCMKGRQR